MAGGAEEIIPVLSNLVFLIPACESVYMRRWTRFMIYLLIIVNSSMYHACAGFANGCVFDAVTHRHLDFFFAQLIIPLTALYIIYFPPALAFLERILIITFAFIIFITQVVWGESNLIQAVLAIVSLLMILIYWSVYSITELIKNPSEGFKLPPYDWSMFMLGLGCTALACNLYATQLQYHLLYWATHGSWHAVAAMGQYFILLIWPRIENSEFESLDFEISEKMPVIRQKNKRWIHVVPRSRSANLQK